MHVHILVIQKLVNYNQNNQENALLKNVKNNLFHGIYLKEFSIWQQHLFQSFN